MDGLSIEHCNLINLVNVPVERFVLNSSSTPIESKQNQLRNELEKD